MPVTAWLLRTPDAVVLVDTGSGDLPAPGMEELHPGWPASTSPLIANLAAAGVAPDDVDLVVCTHVHPDHVGGHTTTVADRFVPTFPNARYVLPRAEYERAAEEAADPDTPTMFVRLFTDRVQPLLDAGVADLVDGVHPVTSEHHHAACRRAHAGPDARGRPLGRRVWPSSAPTSSTSRSRSRIPRSRATSPTTTRRSPRSRAERCSPNAPTGTPCW